jgi:hypothetical protein
VCQLFGPATDRKSDEQRQRDSLSTHSSSAHVPSQEHTHTQASTQTTMSRPNLTITQPPPAMSTNTRSSPRMRNPVDQGPVISTSGTAFTDALTLPSLVAMHSKRPRKQSNAQQYAGSLAALIADTPADEREQSASESEAEDDNTQHEHTAAASSSSSKRTPRVSWKPDMEAELQNALLGYVKKHGRLPPQMKTGKGAVVGAAWKEIVAEIPLLKMDVATAAKACSAKWAKYKKDLKVRASLGLSALAALTDFMLITRSASCQSMCRSVYSAWEEIVRIKEQTRAEEALEEMEDGPAKTAAITAAVKKAVKEQLANVRMVESGACSSIKWAPGYTRSEEYEAAWDALLVHTHSPPCLTDQLLIIRVCHLCLSASASTWPSLATLHGWKTCRRQCARWRMTASSRRLR